MRFPPNNSILVRILYGLLIADIVICCLSFIVGLVSGIISSTIDERLQELGVTPLPNDAAGLQTALSCIYLIAILPALIVSWIGMFNSWWWSRWLYLGITCGMTLLSIPIGFLDFSFNWGLTFAIDNVGSLLGGAISAIVFLSPIAENFNDDNSQVVTSGQANSSAVPN